MKFYKFWAYLFRPLIAFLWPVKVIGRKNIPKGKAVVVCNHFSNIDVPVVGARIFPKEIHMIGKASLFRKKLPRWFLTKGGAIPLSADGNNMELFKTVFRLLNEDKKILLFPEGTRNKSGINQIMPLKAGTAIFALKTKAPILPIMMLHKPTWFQRNYILIGEPFELTQFYDKKGEGIIDEATAYVREKMAEIREGILTYLNRKKK